MNEKSYPKYNWLKLDYINRKKFDSIEWIVKSYLKMENVKWNYPIDVLAYNIAFLIITDNSKLTNKLS